MHRHLARLADETFDVIVIGGGVYGLSTAHALVQRNLTVALLERRDFGGGTSFNSLKTVHGGIRSLQHGAIRDAREFVRERRAIATMAPHLVRILPFVVPTARHPIRNRAAMDVFLRAYDLIATDRNAGLDPAVHLPASYTTTRRTALDLNPLVDPDLVTGSAVWHDYQLHSPERFTLAIARTISDAGAAVANYAEATCLLRRDDRVVGVRARDAITGDAFDVRGRVVINAAGPSAWTLLESSRLTAPPEAGFSLALNLVVDLPPLPRALGGIAAGRFLFLVPWRDRSILGTSHEGFHRHPVPRPAAADIDGLVREGRTAFPGARLDGSRVRLVHKGLLPARAHGAAHGALLKHSLLHDHRADGAPGLLTVLGVRYTTAGATAQAAALHAEHLLGRRPSRPVRGPLTGAAFDGLAAYLQQHPTRERLVRRYGTLHTELPPDALHPLAPNTDVTRAEILYAVRQEMALTLADAALRRTDLAAGGHPGAEALRAAAAAMGAELGWGIDRVDAEIAAVEAELRV